MQDERTRHTEGGETEGKGRGDAEESGWWGVVVVVAIIMAPWLPRIKVSQVRFSFLLSRPRPPRVTLQQAYSPAVAALLPEAERYAPGFLAYRGLPC